MIREYESDFAGWAQDTANAILEGRWSEIDRAALADEVESLGKRDRREIRSRFELLFLHLLKNRYQPERRSKSWESSVRTQRNKIQQLFDESPSLATPSELRTWTDNAYAFARKMAADETGLKIETFPEEMPFTESEVWGKENGNS